MEISRGAVNVLLLDPGAGDMGMFIYDNPSSYILYILFSVYVSIRFLNTLLFSTEALTNNYVFMQLYSLQ